MVTSSSESERFLNLKEKFLLALEGVDLQVLLKKLCMANLITESVRSDFRSLDERVDQNLKVKYLFQLVCSAVCPSNLISGWHQMSKICNQIICICEPLKNDTSGEDPEQEVPLTEDHIPELTEQLANIASKWELLGTALHVSRDKLSEIHGNGKIPQLKLRDVLTTWIIQGTSLENVTLLTLRKKLRSSLVSEIHLSKTLSIKDPSPACKRPCLDSLQYLNPSNIVEVSYGMSVLLESHVPSDEIGSCKWSKATSCELLPDSTSYEPLSDDTSYQGTSSSILLVRSHSNIASRHIEGRYVCEVDSIGRSRERSVRIKYPESIQHIIDINSSLGAVPKDPWPKVVTESYVELALIKKKSESYHFCDYSMQGNIDDFLSNKKDDATSYEECFGKYESGTLLVVEGRPGVGKTTLARKIARDWSKGENVLVDADHVFFISLIDLNINSEISFFDLLKKFYKNLEKTWIEWLKYEQGYRSCFLLDGLDQYQGFNSEKENIIHELVKKEFCKAMVIVFSRPVGNRKLINYEVDVDRRIEILGFRNEQIIHYINTFFKKNRHKAKELMKYLEEHINMLHMCYLPVHVNGICYIHSQDANFFKAETQIYDQLVKLIITRKQHRKCNTSQPEPLSKNDDFVKICELAFDMCVKQRQVFENLNNDCKLSDESDSDGPSLGLVTVDSANGMYNYYDTYAFLHLTLQEYLAAYHVSQTSDRQQLIFINQHKDDEAMLVVWKFYCGIMGQGNKTFGDQVQTIFDSKHADTLYRVHCAFESQQPAVCDAVIGHEQQHNSLMFKNKFFTSNDYNAIIYVMSTASCPTSKLAFYSCKLQENGVKQLIETTRNNRLQQVKAFVFHSPNSMLDQVQSVNCLFSRMKSLEVLEISSSSVGSEGAAALADGLKSCTNLQTLNIIHNGIGSEGAAALANDLKSCTNLQALDITVNIINK